MSDIYAELMAKIVFPSADAAAAFARLKPPVVGDTGDGVQSTARAEPEAVPVFKPQSVDEPAPVAEDIPIVPTDLVLPTNIPAFDIHAAASEITDAGVEGTAVFELPAFAFSGSLPDPESLHAEVAEADLSETPVATVEFSFPLGESVDLPAPGDVALDLPSPFLTAFDLPGAEDSAPQLSAPAFAGFDLPAPDDVALALAGFDLPAPDDAAPALAGFDLPAPDDAALDPVPLLEAVLADEPSEVPISDVFDRPLNLTKPEGAETPSLDDLSTPFDVSPPALAPAGDSDAHAAGALAAVPVPVVAPVPVAMYLVAAPPKVASGPFVPEEFKKVAPRPQATKTKKSLSELVGDYDPADWLEPVLRDLVEAGASDVHLTMNGITKKLTVEARTDGDLELVRVIEGRDASVIVNKLKTNADLSTSSSKVPGDGRYELPIDGFPYRIRAVALPLFDGGEKLVLRLPSTGPLKELEKIGFTEKNLGAVRTLLARPGGMTLIAGPMGEGKTTTAHATIMDIGTNGKAVMAVEDPVERVLPGVAQIEVNEEIGSGFGDIMRFLVRADFDTLFIGEIRDAATAAAAVRMAKAGRRVISTIHATDNVTAMLRLIELSDDSALSVLDAVSGVISQRLVRKIDPETGGYDGRHPIHEVLFINDEFTDKLIENKSLGEIRLAAEATSTTFADNLRELVDAGITDNYESRRVIGHDV